MHLPPTQPPIHTHAVAPSKLGSSPSAIGRRTRSHTHLSEGGTNGGGGGGGGDTSLHLEVDDIVYVQTAVILVPRARVIRIRHVLGGVMYDLAYEDEDGKTKVIPGVWLKYLTLVEKGGDAEEEDDEEEEDGGKEEKKKKSSRPKKDASTTSEIEEAEMEEDDDDDGEENASGTVQTRRSGRGRGAGEEEKRKGKAEPAKDREEGRQALTDFATQPFTQQQSDEEKDEEEEEEEEETMATKTRAGAAAAAANKRKDGTAAGKKKVADDGSSKGTRSSWASPLGAPLYLVKRVFGGSDT